MILRYVFHDCFVLQTEVCAVVFDYWSTADGEQEFPAFLDSLDPQKPLYVLVSHHHKDHYSKYVFGWQHRFPKIHYILSKDTAKFARRYLKEDSLFNGEKVAPEKVTVLRPGEVYGDDCLEIRAFGSTDIGNSYVVTVEGKTVFHAGDLNAWMWKDESTDEEVQEAIGAYQKILDDIKEVFPALDICMMPVDSRIGTDYFTGAHMLVCQIRTAHFFPMHFSLGDEDEQALRRKDAIAFERYANRSYGEYIALTREGDLFLMPS